MTALPAKAAIRPTWAKLTANEPIPDGGRNCKVGTELDSAIRAPACFAELPLLPIPVYSLAELETMESLAIDLLICESNRCTMCI